MAPNSLFAVLLRNPWWVSFLLAAVISVICAALLPKDLVVYGVLGTFPFLVIGCIALSRQWNKPSAAAVQAEVERMAGLSWRDFSKELEAKFIKQGFEVERLAGKKAEGAADFLISKAGQRTLVAAKRYKAANHGIEALQALVAQQESLGADKAMYVCLGALSEQAETYARDRGITVGIAS
ncbi:restriction endonuclease [Variovorax sp. PCZ-1]|uniref:restriction endonuclease n=1 Tax=Variovorax sp. PCZ-1 TaxID=2835533 RepID=UPI001BCEF5A5|nr:restriction endonuclease [Variovorax sp. PCZ-1]MBS7807444.1 restriction endonuclease [Variovorax sp. PCZ-1]